MCRLRSSQATGAIGPLVIAACLLATGCGGAPARGRGASASTGESTHTGRTAAIPPAASSVNTSSTTGFIARADAICARVNDEIPNPKSAGTTMAAVAREVPGIAAIERRGVAELKALSPPATLAQQWRRIVGYRSTLAGKLVPLIRYARQRDLRKVAALGQVKARVHHVLFLAARRIGSQQCGKVE